MISLVQRLPQEHEVTQKAPIQYQFAFALNRRNHSGDREKALLVLEEVGVVGVGRGWDMGGAGVGHSLCPIMLYVYYVCDP